MAFFLSLSFTIFIWSIQRVLLFFSLKLFSTVEYIPPFKSSFAFDVPAKKRNGDFELFDFETSSMLVSIDLLGNNRENRNWRCNKKK